MAFKSKTSSSIGTSGSATTVTDTVAASTTHTIIGLSLSNKVTSNITVTASITKNSGTLTYLVKDATVLPGGALVVIGGDQKLVLEASGFKIHKCQVLHANADYRRNGDIDYHALTRISDVTDKVEKILDKTEVDMSKALSVVISEVRPDLDPMHASSNFFSDWLKIREELEPRLPDNSIYKLPKISYRVAGNLIAKNIKTKPI